MAIKIGINGYGRIGRNILRALYESKRTGEVSIVAINDLGDANTNAHLTRHDTAHGPFPGKVAVDGNHMVVNGDRIRVLAERDPSKLPWGELGVEIVLECTGLFANKEKASRAPGRRREESRRIGAGRRRRRHDRLRRESPDAAQGHDGHLERVLHDELPCAAREAAARRPWRRGRHHDDGARLHQ